jgi:pimeloyl-ACP methyl ester carboxylesterase
VSISPPSNTRGLIEKFARALSMPAKAESNLAQRFETNFGKNIWEDVSMVNTVKQLKIPGLLIHDSHDVDIPWQEGHAVAQEWSNARFIKTSGLGHRRILRDATVIESVVRFINDDN